MPEPLKAREYKLLLSPTVFAAAPDEAAARGFYSDRLLPVVKAIDGLEAEGAFREDDRREIRFFETANRVLKRSGFALRRRGFDGGTEVTLKLRLPDLFVVAETALPGTKPKAESKFEEDIAPLEVARKGGGLTIADPPSIRSRFARSTSQESGQDLATLEDAFGLYPTLRDVLALADRPFSEADPLVGGPRILETVFRGPTVDLGRDATAEFALSWWEFIDPAAVRSVAEISYKVETDHGEMREKPARRALALFVGLQRGLGDCVDLEHSSKTELALPPLAG